MTLTTQEKKIAEALKCAFDEIKAMPTQTLQAHAKSSNPLLRNVYSANGSSALKALLGIDGLPDLNNDHLKLCETEVDELSQNLFEKGLRISNINVFSGYTKGREMISKSHMISLEIKEIS